ncbi:MAG: hypothetical protein Sapg2KO_53050 [Saprospiraceae bacterium]
MKSPTLLVLFLFLTLPMLAQQQQNAESRSIAVQTVTNTAGDRPQIALIKKTKSGVADWFSIFGGTSYERASDVTETPDGGYIILGSTSSYGNGNYDLILIKTDANGQQEWFKTFGDFYNEYGESIELSPSGNYLIGATKQLCTGKKNNFSLCKDYPWQLELNPSGNLIKEQVSDQAVKR